MGTAEPFDAGPGRRHIIKRPRLTRLLDEATARIILLVAPAGYGKTILGKEWAETHAGSFVWCAATDGSSDVAAHALELAGAAEQVIPGSAARIRAALTAADPGRLEIERLLGDVFSRWPPRTWLVIDDYHHVVGSPEAERIVAALSELENINLLIASRRRPNWATARRLVYGDIHEIGATVLALTNEEAVAILGTDARARASGLVALANGWPAVIGLAAFAANAQVPEEQQIPSQLFEFFADELYQAAAPAVRLDLHRISMLVPASMPLIERAFGARASSALDEAERLGFIVRSHEYVELHPLLRQFLNAKLADVAPDAVTQLATAAANDLLHERQWDRAFDVIRRFRLAPMVHRFVAEGLEPVLGGGRVGTWMRWSQELRLIDPASPALDLVDAEVLFRKGDAPAAAELAASVAESLTPADPLAARAHLRAGQAAHVAGRPDASLHHHNLAFARARDDAERRRALWGRLVTEAEFDEGDAERTAREFEALASDAPDDVLRAAQARLLTAGRRGGITASLRLIDQITPLLTSVADPLIQSSFANRLSFNLLMAARYEDALRWTRYSTELAERVGLSFAIPHSQLSEAIALVGLRRLRLAERNADAAEVVATEAADWFLRMNILLVRTRCLVARGDPQQALSLLRRGKDDGVGPGLKGEVLALEALLAAVTGDLKEAAKRADEAMETTHQVEALVLASSARAVIAIARGSTKATNSTLDAWKDAVTTGNFDSFVTAYRAFPPLVHRVRTAGPAERHTLERLLTRARDQSYLRPTETAPPPEALAQLSRREREVLALVARGATNQEIARSLWLSEATVKVHVRHICEKLGVRRRGEAAAVAARHAAPNATDELA